MLGGAHPGRDHRAAGDCCAGCSGCGCRTLLVQIMSFMVRYLDVVTDELRRMQIALASRGFAARDPAALAGARPLGGVAVHPLATSAASGSTSRCSRAATPAGCRRRDHARPRRPRPRVRLPGRPPGALRRRPARAPRRAGRAARPQRRGQDHARAAPQRHPDRRAPARSPSAACRSTKAQPARDPPPRRHRLPGPRRPAVHADGPRGRRLRPGQPRPARRRARAAGDGGPRRGRAWPTFADRPPHHLSLRAAPPGGGRDGAGDAAGDPGARRAVLQPRPGLPARARRHPALARRHRR